MNNLLSPPPVRGPSGPGIITHDDSFRNYATFFSERCCRSLIWNELSRAEWSKGGGGGIRIFFQDGKSSIRTVGFGDQVAVVKIEFDDDTFISGLTAQPEGLERLSPEEFEALKAAATERVLDELWDGRVLESTLESDRLVVDWQGVQVMLEATGGEMPNLTLDLRMRGAA